MLQELIIKYLIYKKKSNGDTISILIGRDSSFFTIFFCTSLVLRIDSRVFFFDCKQSTISNYFWLKCNETTHKIILFIRKKQIETCKLMTSFSDLKNLRSYLVHVRYTSSNKLLTWDCLVSLNELARRNSVFCTKWRVMLQWKVTKQGWVTNPFSRN